MSYDRDEWRSYKRDVNRAGRFGLGWIIVIVAVVLALGAVIWGISVAVAPVKGKGDAFKEQQSSENWTAAQARFEEMYADIVASDRKIDVAAELLASDPEDKTYQQTLAGTKSYCLEIVGDYNAEARKYLSEDFRSADLPEQINTNDPDTDCKESF